MQGQTGSRVGPARYDSRVGCWRRRATAVLEEWPSATPLRRRRAQNPAYRPSAETSFSFSDSCWNCRKSLFFRRGHGKWVRGRALRAGNLGKAGGSYFWIIGLLEHLRETRFPVPKITFFCHTSFLETSRNPGGFANAVFQKWSNSRLTVPVPQFNALIQNSVPKIPLRIGIRNRA